MSQIHPTAFVDSRAQIGANVTIGPFCHVDADVVLHDDCVLHPRVTLLGPSEFGRACQFFPNCVLGAAPQDLKFRGGPTRLVAGEENVFREHVTAHRGTEVDDSSGGVTRIGDGNLLMVGVHIAHDAQLGNRVIIANNALIAGHVRIEDHVNIGGAAAVHHFVTIGQYAFIGGITRITHDVPPYVKAVGWTQEVRGVNVEGLRRWKFEERSIASLKRAARMLFPRRDATAVGRITAAITEIETSDLYRDEHVRALVDFVRRKSSEAVFGRTLETRRTDTDSDRDSFYLRGVTEIRP
ncbi:MAG: acyl-ACP--UDP-N-acetylglucosamine O-acyltransferase [Phycisphaerales bacterium]|nr:acyl-ACP--UDP-N-acetylglucosamine O-acyltransferase [Phycisphaerales bacterium]